MPKLSPRSRVLSPNSPDYATALHAMNDENFQLHLLKGVSRTFALTIPQLPGDLQYVVTNAYLLCRAVDTIEDEPALTLDQKKLFCDQFVELIEHNAEGDAKIFATQLAPLLTQSTLPAEQQLIRHIDRVINITHEFAPQQQAALARCVKTMAEGMIYFQDNPATQGLQDMAEMDKYCYYVAGVVGEMLTDLFSYYSPKIAERHTDMMALAVSFGQGLQMTNILKDVWEDYRRGACWLPRDLFEKSGFSLDDMAPNYRPDNFQNVYNHLIAIAHKHLKNAFDYTLMIPAKETGIREFCLWAIGMAVLTLKKIHKTPNFIEGKEVKISRKSVKATVVLTHMSVSQDWLLRLLFNSARFGLPTVTV